MWGQMREVFPGLDSGPNCSEGHYFYALEKRPSSDPTYTTTNIFSLCVHIRQVTFGENVWAFGCERENCLNNEMYVFKFWLDCNCFCINPRKTKPFHWKYICQ